MSQEKVTDAMKWVGQILPYDIGRDAIHIPTVSAMAGCQLSPTEPVRYENGKWWPTDGQGRGVGLVDPFLPPTKVIEPGQWFLVFLYPGSIEALRHVWRHKDLPDEPVADGAVARITRSILNPEAK